MPITARMSMPLASGCAGLKIRCTDSLMMSTDPTVSTMQLINAPSNEKPFVTVRKLRISFLLRFFLKVPRSAERETVTQIVQCIGENGYRVGVQATHELKHSKAQVQPERYLNILCAIIVVMRVIV
jgi:hypothetical protein